MRKRIKYLKNIIEKHYYSFGVNIYLVEVKIIVNLRRYIFKVKILPGVKVKSIFDFAEDIKIALQFPIFQPFKEENSVFLVVSEFDIVENELLKILTSPKFLNSKMQIPLALGFDYVGNAYIVDLVNVQHLLISGLSGTGKSVALQCMIVSMITGCSVGDLRLILFDIGGNSLAVFEKVKHLYHPVVKDYEEGIKVLAALNSELERRILLGEEACAELPFLVCAIDEFDDTIANIGDKNDKFRFQTAIKNIINRGRKAKIIVVVTSLNPSEKETNVNINGIGSRISFQCVKHQKSSNALGTTGAESLSGIGAMMFRAKGSKEIVALQGAYITKDEIRKILCNAPIGYDDISMLNMEAADVLEVFESVVNTSENERKEFAKIIFYTLEQETMSVNKLQKAFNMGKRANEIIDMLCEKGIITGKFANQPRKVIPACIEDVPNEIINFLVKYGYNQEQIKNMFNEKSNNKMEMSI